MLGAARTPTCLRGGRLHRRHPVDLLADVLQAVVQRSGVDVATLASVVVGCVNPVGEQAHNVARNAVLASGWPHSVAAATLDAGPGSIFPGVTMAAAALRTPGAVALVGGVQSASRVPPGASTGLAAGRPFGPGVHDRYEAEGGLVPPGVAAERLAREVGITRHDLDAWALARRQLPHVSGPEVVPVAEQGHDGSSSAMVETDDGHPLGTPPADRPSMFEPDGLLTSATFALPADGAAGVALASAATAHDLGVRPLARIRSLTWTGSNPLIAGDGAAAARSALEEAGLAPSALGQLLIHEDSAVTPLAFAAALGLSLDRFSGVGALAIGETGGAAGAALLATAAHAVAEGGSPALVVVAGISPTIGALVLTAD